MIEGYPLLEVVLSTTNTDNYIAGAEVTRDFLATDEVEVGVDVDYWNADVFLLD